jgi:hypothetical protein
VTLYDALGSVIGVGYSRPVADVLAHGATTTFTASFASGIVPRYTGVTARTHY